MKHDLLESLSILLLKKGFTVKTLTRTCFDILARKNSMILLIKVLEDADSVSSLYADDMKNISSAIDASPIMISEKAHEKLLDNVVYSRYGIKTLNYATFSQCLENNMPFVARNNAGLTASVIGKKLRESREEMGFSLAQLARKLGVTSRMVTRYETEDSEITISKAVKMYDIFGNDVFSKIDIFSETQFRYKTEKNPITEKYHVLGFKAASAKKAPFDIIAKQEKEIILTGIGDSTNKHTQSISQLLDADNLIIFRKKKPKDLPSLTKKEFMDFEKAEELVKFIKEF